MPEVRLVDAVQHQVGERDGKDEVLLLAAEEGVVLQRVDVRAGGRVAQLARDVLVGHGEKAAGAAAGIVDRVCPASGWTRVHHRADHFARREELAAVGVLLAHLQQQVFVHLREREEVRVVHVVDADLVHLVEDVAQVGFAVHAHALDGGHDAADDALLPAGVGIRQLGLGINVEAVQVRQQLGVDEIEELAVALGEQFLPLPAVGLALVGLRMRRDRP